MLMSKSVVNTFRTFLWISVFLGYQVEGYFNDVLNPVLSTIDVWHQQRNTRVALREDVEQACDSDKIYICEEPPETIHWSSGKQCNYRNVNYHEQVFKWVAGRGCLLYTPDFLYVGGVNTIDLNVGCFYGDLYAPCLEIVKEDGTCGCFPFDPSLVEVATAVRDALIPAAHGRWERCFYAAVDCCSHFMSGEDVATENATQCGATFDGWSCWPPAVVGSVAQEVCSEFAYSNTGPSCNHYSNKACNADGSWELQTDYSPCSVTPRLLRRYRFYIAVLCVSIAACLPAVFIFFFYKRLRVTRVILHRNLLIAIVVRNLLVVVSRSEIYIDELTNSGDTVMSTHGILCRVLAISERLSANVVFLCMLVEGIYLHRLIVAVFRSKLNVKMLYGVGSIIAVFPVIAWALVMGFLNDHSCWLVYTIEHIQWILDAPRILILLINTGLFIDIVRVLLTKIRNSENVNQLNTAKATLFLMPLFGSQFLLTALRPSTDNCTGEQIYYYVTYAVEGLQGFIVAMFYCYINKEVHNLIKSTYKKTETAVISRVRRESNYRRNTLGTSSDNRTYSTGMDNNQTEDKPRYSTTAPRLHAAEVISIQATERLAEILEPVYETIPTGGIVNEGYDTLNRSDMDGGFHQKDKDRVEEYYGFTNASSVSIDCQDWIRCISSPSSSVYDNSLNEYEVKYLERKFPDHTRRRAQSETPGNVYEENDISYDAREHGTDKKETSIDEQSVNTNIEEETSALETDTEYKDSEEASIVNEIIKFMENSDRSGSVDIQLNPELLSPNRSEDDKIVFVNE